MTLSGIQRRWIYLMEAVAIFIVLTNLTGIQSMMTENYNSAVKNKATRILLKKGQSTYLTPAYGINSSVPTRSFLPTAYPTYIESQPACVDDSDFRTTQGRMTCIDLLLIVLALPCQQMELIRFTTDEVDDILRSCPKTCNACPKKVGTKRNRSKLGTVTKRKQPLETPLPSNIRNISSHAIPTINPITSPSEVPTEVPSNFITKLPSISPSVRQSVNSSPYSSSKPSSSSSNLPSTLSAVPSRTLSSFPTYSHSDGSSIHPSSPPLVFASSGFPTGVSSDVYSPTSSIKTKSKLLRTMLPQNPTTTPSIGSSFIMDGNPNETLMSSFFPSPNQILQVEPLSELLDIDVEPSSTMTTTIGVIALASVAIIAAIAHLYIKRTKMSTMDKSDFKGQMSVVPGKLKTKKQHRALPQANAEIDMQASEAPSDKENQISQIVPGENVLSRPETPNAVPTQPLVHVVHSKIQVVSQHSMGMQQTRGLVPFRIGDRRSKLVNHSPVHLSQPSNPMFVSKSLRNNFPRSQSCIPSGSALNQSTDMNNTSSSQKPRPIIRSSTLQSESQSHITNSVTLNCLHQPTYPEISRPMSPNTLTRTIQSLQSRLNIPVSSCMSKNTEEELQTPTNQSSQISPPVPLPINPTSYQSNPSGDPGLHSYNPSSQDIPISSFYPENLPASLRIRSMSPQKYKSNRAELDLKRSRTSREQHTLDDNEVLNNEELEKMNVLIQHMSQLLTKLPLQKFEASVCESMLKSVQDIENHLGNHQQLRVTPQDPFSNHFISTPDLEEDIVDNESYLSNPSSLPSQLSVRRNKSGDISEISVDEDGSTDSSWKRVQFDW